MKENKNQSEAISKTISNLILDRANDNKMKSNFDDNTKIDSAFTKTIGQNCKLINDIRASGDDFTIVLITVDNTNVIKELKISNLSLFLNNSRHFPLYKKKYSINDDKPILFLRLLFKKVFDENPNILKIESEKLTKILGTREIIDRHKSVFKNSEIVDAYLSQERGEAIQEVTHSRTTANTYIESHITDIEHFENSPYYNDALDMDQQSQEFWDDI